MSAPEAQQRKPLSFSTIFFYAGPAVPISAMGLPLVVHLPPFYAGPMGLGLSLVGAIFMLARFWDVFTDPVIGILSDKFETRWGRRRHWIVASVPLMMISVVMVFMPNAASVTGGYLMFWMFFLFIGWTLLTISHLSWGAELTPDYHERTRVQSAREVMLILGMVFVLLLPALIESMNPEHGEAAGVESMGWFVLILLPITVALAVWRVPEHKTPRPQHVPFKQAVAVLAASSPLRRVLVADLALGVSGGTVASLFLFVTRDALMLGKFANLGLLVYFIAGVVFVPVVMWVSRRVGKHKAAALSSMFNTVTIPIILFIPAHNMVFAGIVMVLLGLNMAASPFLFRSIMADVADHDAVETGQKRTGLFFAMLTMTNKFGAALAIGFTYLMLDLIGYVPGGENTQAALDGLRMVYVTPTFIVGFIVLYCVWNFPIDEIKQKANRDILEDRERRTSTLDIAAGALETRTFQPSDPQSSSGTTSPGKAAD